MLIFGYFYDENGHYTEMKSLQERPVYEKQTFYREERKEVVTEENLCELHQEDEEGKHGCPNCVMYNVGYETVQVPYFENVIVGYEPDIPANCTLVPVPDLRFEPVFRDGAWVLTKELPPEVIPPEVIPPEDIPKDPAKEEEILRKKIDSRVEELIGPALEEIKQLRKANRELSSTLQSTRYYLQVVLPSAKHYFE